MNSSPTIGKLMDALCKAQSAMRPAEKDSENPHFGSSFASLASVIAAARDSLAGNGLAVSQQLFADGSKVTVNTVLGHTSGEWIESSLTMVARDASPQSIGSACTYGRRYGYSAIICMAVEEDDGHAAQPQQPAPRPTVKPVVKVVTKPAAPAAPVVTTSTLKVVEPDWQAKAKGLFEILRLKDANKAAAIYDQHIPTKDYKSMLGDLEKALAAVAEKP